MTGSEAKVNKFFLYSAKKICMRLGLFEERAT